MDPSGDNSPLWGAGAAQLSFPDYNRHPQPPQWPDSSDPHQQVMQSSGYNPYPIPPVDGGSYTELRTSPEVVEADSTNAENGGVIYHGYHHLPAGPAAGDVFPVPTGGYQPSYVSQLPFSNSNNILLPESGSYPSAEAGGPGQTMSPDGGYSSPGPEYYASYQLAPQAYSAASPYQNVDSPPEHELVKYEVLEVKEEPGVYRSDQYSAGYPQPSDAVQEQQHDGASKPIIHGNIMIKPADQSQPPSYRQAEFQIVQVQYPMSYHALQPHMEQAGQIPQHIQHQEPIKIELKIANHPPLKAPSKQRKPRRSRPYPAVTYDQQSPDLEPSTPAPKFRVLQANPPTPGYSKPDEEESEESCARRSARPSVIECSDYKCKKCGTFFARQCGLTQHQKWIHAERKFQCERCGKKFPSQEDLTTHIKRHDMKDKPFKCAVCPKQFCHKNDLRRHMYRHEDRTPYMCDSCPKCFIRKDHLLAHQLSHDRREKRSHDKENGSPL